MVFSLCFSKYLIINTFMIFEKTNMNNKIDWFSHMSYDFIHFIHISDNKIVFFNVMYFIVEQCKNYWF